MREDEFTTYITTEQELYCKASSKELIDSLINKFQEKQTNMDIGGKWNQPYSNQHMIIPLLSKSEEKEKETVYVPMPTPEEQEMAPPLDINISDGDW